MARTNRLTPHVLIERRTRRGELVLTCRQQRRGVVFRTPRHGCHRLLSVGEIGGPDVGEGSAAATSLGQVLSFADDRSQHMDLVQLRSLFCVQISFKTGDRHLALSDLELPATSDHQLLQLTM